jgi:hypothetical protein
MGCGCHRAPSVLERAANPALRKLPVCAPCGSGIGSLLTPDLGPFPQDVTAEIRKADPLFMATNATVERCANLSSPDAVAWGGFYKDWRKTADEGVHVFGSWEGQLKRVKEQEAELRTWQEKIGAICPLSTPFIEVPSSPFPLGTVLLVGAGVVVVGAVGYSFYRAAQQASARASKGKAYLERAVDDQLSRVGSASSASRQLSR